MDEGPAAVNASTRSGRSMRGDIVCGMMEPAGRVPATGSTRLLPPLRALRVVAGRQPVRGLPGRDPHPEHRLDERGAGARGHPQPRAAVLRALSALADAADRRAHPPVRHLQGQGAAGFAPSSTSSGASTAARLEAMATPRSPAAAGQAARGHGIGPETADSIALYAGGPAAASSWTRTRGGCSRGWGCFAGTRATTRSSASSWNACPRTPRCSTTTMRRSCGWPRTHAGRGRGATACALDPVCAKLGG